VILSLALAAVALAVPSATTAAPAAAAPAPYTCLPGHGLMSANTAAGIMAGSVALGDGRTISIGTTGDTVWARRTMDAGATRLLASMSWANLLIRETNRTGNQAYADRARAFAADFVRDNPVGGGARPTDTWTPMYAGQRTSFLSCLSLNRPNDATITSWLTAHGTWLAAPANHGGDWNQGLEAAIGLLGAGCRLGRADLRTTASTRLGSMITQSVDAQGAFLEQAPGYLGFVHGRWQLASAKLTECGQPVPPEIAQRLPKMLDFAAWATAGNGRLVQIGDTFSDPPPSIAGTASQYAATQGASGTPLTGQDAVYGAGYVFGRTSWTPFTSGIHWSLRFGPGRAWHGHYDHQSVTLTSGTRPVLVEGGHSGYASATQRTWQRLPEAHNVVVLPGVRFSGATATPLTRQAAGPSWRWYEVADAAYTSSPRTRGVYVDPALGFMLVQDRVNRPTAGLVQQLWHLPAGTSVALSGRSAAVGTSPDGKLQTVVLQVPLAGDVLPRGSTTAVTGQASPLQGWVSTKGGEFVKAPTVITARSGTSARMVTLVVGVPTGTPVSASGAASGNSSVVTIDIGGKRTQVGISAGGGMWKVG
jgi:hypothetical protein